MLDVEVDDGIYVNDEKRKCESDSGISFCRDTHRVWGTSFELSTAESSEIGINTKGRPW